MDDDREIVQFSMPVESFDEILIVLVRIAAAREKSARLHQRPHMARSHLTR